MGKISTILQPHEKFVRDQTRAAEHDAKNRCRRRGMLSGAALEIVEASVVSEAANAIQTIMLALPA